MYESLCLLYELNAIILPQNLRQDFSHSHFIYKHITE